jgi:glyoxylase-like metal-dependent hydrolase (beta-lactamase superfamily II)
VRVRCLTTGVVRAKRGSRGIRRYLVDAWRDETLPVHAFLVEHPEGPCLFDTGQTADAAMPGYFPRWQPFFRLSRFELSSDDEIAPALRRAGVDPGDLRWIVLSHLHTDHVGGLASLPRGEVLVNALEWRRANGVRGRLRGYLPERWPPGRRPRLVAFDGPPVGPFPSSHDVAADGTMLLVPAPGHTPGHAALLVRGDEGGWLLGGDLAHSRDELRRAAPAVAEYCAAERLVFLATHDPASAALAPA